MKYFLLILTNLLFLNSAHCYELTIIQGLSKEQQTFITRNNPSNSKDISIIKGKRATFTADNVSIIATAIKVTNEFIQWEIKNEYTDVPFQRGDVVTMYDTTEYLWALNPEKAKRNFVKNKLYKPRRSVETTLGFTSGLSETFSNSTPQDSSRAGYQFDLTFRNEFNINYSISYGIRFSQDIITYTDSSVENYQFMGLIEGRYYFNPMPKFYDAQIGVAFGMGYGQTSTVADDQTTTGTVMLLPMTKLSLVLPISEKSDIEFISGFESLRFDESDATGKDNSTNLINARFGVMFRKHL